MRSGGGGGGRLRTGRGKHHARERERFALDQGVRSLDQRRDRSFRLSVREALTGPGADFMSTSPMGANKPIEYIEATLLAATKSASDELVWWAQATMAAKAAEASLRRDRNRRGAWVRSGETATAHRN